MPDLSFPVSRSSSRLFLFLITVALVFVRLVALRSASLGPFRDFKSVTASLGATPKHSTHHSSSAHHGSTHHGSSKSNGHNSNLGGVTSMCQNVPADNAAGNVPAALSAGTFWHIDVTPP